MSKDNELDRNVLDVIDYRGKRVIFTEEKWKEKCIVHPELLNKTFLKNLPKAIVSPECVWQDFSDPRKKRCYYWRYGVNRYIKVVIWIFGASPSRVVSAFETNYIKETKYPNLKQLK